MLGRGSKKVASKRVGILNVFTKTINNLESLQKETSNQIEVQNQKIAREQEEQQALLQENAIIGNTLVSMKRAIGIEETPQPQV